MLLNYSYGGQLQRVTNALGQSTTYNSYDAAGRLLSMADANGLQTQYSYDLRGRVLSVTKTPAGGLSRVTTTTTTSPDKSAA